MDESTVREDLGKRSAGNPAPVVTSAAESLGLDDADAGNPAPAWFQGDVNPAQLAKKKSAKGAKAEAAKARNVAKLSQPFPEGKYGAIYADASRNVWCLAISVQSFKSRWVCSSDAPGLV